MPIMPHAAATEDDLTARIALWGLAPDPQASDRPAGSKNRVVLARGANGDRAVVKAAYGPGPAGPAWEGSVIRALHSARCRLGLPEVIGFDAQRGILALRWIAPAETLFDYHRRTGKFEPAIARHLGRAMGILHREGLSPPASLKPGLAERADIGFVDRLVYVRPEFYARLSRPGIDLLAMIHADKGAYQALFELTRQRVTACLLHGDMKLANVLRSETSDLVLLDWELACWGDPARDVGGLVAAYVLEWLLPPAWPGVLQQGPLREFLRAMHAAYRRERGAAFPLERDFKLRATRWAGAAVLFHAYGFTHFEGRLDDRGRRLAQYALEMLSQPHRWAWELWEELP